MEKCNVAILGIAIIWAVVIITSSLILEGTSYFSQMFPILGGGAARSIIVLGASRPVMVK